MGSWYPFMLLQAKEKELDDATKLCQSYHAALEEANANAAAAQAKTAELVSN